MNTCEYVAICCWAMLFFQVFMGKNYLENFVQATFDALKATGVPVEGGTIVIGGDGRYFNKDRCQQLQQLIDDLS